MNALAQKRHRKSLKRKRRKALLAAPFQGFPSARGERKRIARADVREAIKAEREQEVKMRAKEGVSNFWKVGDPA